MARRFPEVVSQALEKTTSIYSVVLTGFVESFRGKRQRARWIEDLERSIADGIEVPGARVSLLFFPREEKIRGGAIISLANLTAKNRRSLGMIQ